MKNLLITLFVLGAFGTTWAQDLRFSYSSQSTGTTSEVKIFVTNVGLNDENLAGYTVNFYYDNSESTLTGFDTSPAAALGWNVNAPFNPFIANSNPAVSITHTGYGTINVIDQNVVGTDIDKTGPVHILTINFDDTPGSALPSATWLASTADNHLALQYVGNDFVGHSVISTPTPGSFPVELLDFEAETLEDRASLLSWVTASELNNKGFEIERADGRDLSRQWERIGFVEGKGTTSNTTEYAFIDPVPYRRENLYRLRQVDFDGAFVYSDVRSVRFVAIDGLNVYPNPTTDILYVEFSGSLQNIDSALYTLMDQRGRVIFSGEFDTRVVSPVSLASIPEGIYMLKVVQAGTTMEKRVIKID